MIIDSSRYASLDVDTTGSDAITVAETKTIYFREDVLTKIIVRHEILHAFVYGFHLTSAKLTAEQMEEIIAEWLSVHVEDYVKICDKIWTKIEAWKKSQATPLA